MSIIPTKLSLSDEEDGADNLDENEPELFSTNIRKQLMDDFNSETPMKMTRESINHKREHMKVFLRIRPFTNEELEAGEEQDCMQVSRDTTLTMRAPKNSFAFKSSQRGCQEMTHNFTFTAIHGSQTSQKSFFDETMLSSVKSVIDGQNCLIFTYGVTNAGKTYTIQGVPEDGGILPRTLDVIFNSIEGRHFDSMRLKPKYFCDVIKLTDGQVQSQAAAKAAILSMASSSPQQEIEPDSLEASDIELSKLSSNSTANEDSLMSDTSTTSASQDSNKESDVTQSLLNDIRSRIPDDTSIDVEAQGPVKFSIWVSFAEIYNEYIYDLLEAMPKSKKVRRQALKLSEDKNGSIFVKGLKEIQVSNADEAYKVLKIGQKNLSIAATKLNHNSSRSHCIFSIKILRVVDVADPHVARVSKISFCDLAGSERSTKTQSAGDRLKEAGNINTSLLTLGKCIHALRYNQNHSSAHPKVIPFRESKLTRLFQSFFLGKGIASMIVNVNQCASMFDETMHVLKFSAIAKQVTTVTSKLDNKWQMPKPKNKLISARALSLAVGKSMNSTSRASVPWATPRTMAREVQRASDLTRIDESIIDEEDEDDDLDETLFDDEERTPAGKDGIAGTSRTVLVNLVEVLKNELIEAKQQLRTMETQIRAEVCEEMAKQLVQIEASYNERLQEEKEMVEEVYEKKMEILTKSVKKTHSKRPRMQEDTEEFVPAMVHTALKTKMEEKDERIAELSEELERSQSELKRLQIAKEAEMKNMAEMKETVSEESTKHQEQIKLLEQTANELRAAKSEVESQLEATKDRVHNLSGQIEKMKADSISEQNRLKEDFQAQVEEAVSRKEAELKERVQNNIQSSNAQMEDLLSSKEQLEAINKELTEQLGELEEKTRNDYKVFKEQLDEGLAERETLTASHQEVLQELAGYKESAASEKETYEAQLEKALSEKEELAAANQESAKELTALREALAKLKEDARNDRQLEEVLSEKESLTAAHQKLVQELSELKEHAGNERQDFKAQLEKAIFEKEELAANQEELLQRMAEMKEGATTKQEDSQTELKKAVSERDELAARHEDLVQQIAALKEGASKEKEDSQTELKKAVSERDELAAQHDDLVEEIAMLKEGASKEKEELQARLERATSEKEELAASKDELEQLLAEMREGTSSEEQKLLDQINMMSEEQEKLKNFITDLEEQMATVTSSADEEKRALEMKFEEAIKERDLLVTSLEAQEGQIKNMREEHMKNKEELESRLEVAESAAMNAKLQSRCSQENDTSRDHSEELERRNSEITDLKSEIAKLTDERKKFEGNLDQLKEENQKGLREMKDQLEEEISGLQAQLTEAQRKLEDASTTKQELSIYKKRLESVVVENEKLLTNKTDLEHRLDNLKKQIDQSKEEQQEVMAENKELSNMIQVLEKKTVDLTTQAIELTTSKVQETEEATKVRLENRRLNAKVPVLEKQVDELMEEIPELRKRNKELITKNEELQETLKRENSMRDELFKEKTDMAEEIADLKQRVESANEKRESEVVSLTREVELLKQAAAGTEEVIVRRQASVEESVKEDDADDEEDEEEEECTGAYTVDDLEDGLQEEPADDHRQSQESSRISFAEQASTDTSRVEVDATPLMKKKKQKPTKTKKRKSCDLLEDESDAGVSKKKKRATTKDGVAPRRQTRGMNRANRSKTVPVRFEEQENIPEEGQSPDSVSLTDATTKKGALSKIGGILKNSPIGQSEPRVKMPKVHLHRLSLTAKKLVGSASSPAAKSPQKTVEVHAEGKRRKRKLFKTDISAPFECSPFETVKISTAKDVATNQRVTRSLRSRNKKNAAS